jgi:hypothetical protein
LNSKGYDLPGFVEFGPKFGDEIVFRKDDSFTGPLLLPNYFPFFNKKISKFYININGLISFDDELSVFDKINFAHNISYLSIFWSDINTRYNGHIFHRKIASQSIFNYLNNLVKKSVNFNETNKTNDSYNIYNNNNNNNNNDKNGSRYDFITTWAYVITWYGVEPHRRYNEIGNNTFQLVILIYHFMFLFYF